MSSASQRAMRDLAAKTGDANVISAEDAQALFRDIDLDNDPTTLTADELDSYMAKCGSSTLERTLMRERAFMKEKAGPDLKYTPEEAIAAAINRTDGEIFGIRIRR